MEEKVLSGMGGVGIYGVISICIFFAFFIGMALWAAGLKKSYINSMRELPLDGGERGPEAPVPSEEQTETKTVTLK